MVNEIGINDVIVGGKNASLGEMVRALSAKGVNVPNGFDTSGAPRLLPFNSTELLNGTSLLFSRDLGCPNDLLMAPPSVIRKTDYLVIESSMPFIF